MDRSTATALRYGMQVSQTNLGRRRCSNPPQPRTPVPAPNPTTTPIQATTPGAQVRILNLGAARSVSRVILTPDGDEIAPPVEMLEPNEAEPIHHKGCPCLLCAEKYRNQPPEEHHPACQCGLCEEAEESEQQGPESEGSGLRNRDREALIKHAN